MEYKEFNDGLLSQKKFRTRYNQRNESEYLKNATDFSCYLGRVFTTVNTKLIPNDYLKVGQQKQIPAIFRGRNQGGCSWMYHALFFTSENNRFTLERKFKEVLRPYSIPGPDNQTELYNFNMLDTYGIVIPLLLDSQEIKNLTTELHVHYHESIF